MHALALIAIDGIPVHPLVVHAVVVLLPLAALGGLVIAVRPSWRQRFGLVVLALTAAGVGAVPVAIFTGGELKTVEYPAVSTEEIDDHQRLGDALLPYSIAFGVAILLLLIAGRLADRERAAARSATGSSEVAASNTWRRVAIVAAALVAFTAVATTVQVIRAGHSGAATVWDGVGS